MEKENKEVKSAKKFNFKEYYDSNPDFRTRHKAKQLTKVLCTCGRAVNRCSLCRHKKSKIHMTQLELNAIK